MSRLSRLLTLLHMAVLLAAGEPDGAAQLAAAIAREAALPALSLVLTTTVSGDTGLPSSATVSRQHLAEGGVAVRIELAPATARGREQPAAFTKTFLFRGGRCYLLYRGKAALVIAGLVPDDAIEGLVYPTSSTDHWTSAPCQRQGQDGVHLTQRIIDASGGITQMVYDIDSLSGVVVAISRSDQGAAAYTIDRSHLDTAPIAEDRFAIPRQVASQRIEDMPQLLAAFKEGIGD